MSSKANRFVRSDFVKSLIDVSKIEVTPELQEELKINFNLNYDTPPPDVPFVMLQKLLPFLHERAFPEMSFDEACNELGFRNVAYFLSTAAGKVYVFSSRLIPREKKIDLFVRNLRLVFTWGDISSQLVEDVSYRIFVKNVPINPEVIAGMMRAGREVVEGKKVVIRITAKSEEDFMCEADW